MSGKNPIGVKKDEWLYGDTKEKVLGNEDYEIYRRVKRKLLEKLREHRAFLVKHTNIYSGEGMKRLKDVENAIAFWQEV